MRGGGAPASTTNVVGEERTAALGTLSRVLWALIAATLAAGACTESGGSPARNGGGLVRRMQEAVSVEGIAEHLHALARIAEEEGGTRAVGTAGYDRSVEYVSERLEAAGYTVAHQDLEIPYFEQVSPAVLEVIGSPATATDGLDFTPLIYSHAGEVEARVVPVDFEPQATGRTGPGCDPSTFPGSAAGAIVLLRPGPCLLRDQVLNAQGAGAAAVVFAFPEFSHGHVLQPTLIFPEDIAILALAATDRLGRRLAKLGTKAHIAVDVVVEPRSAASVIADSPSGDAGRVLVVGAHLDSVAAGPGINDNGSGVATLLEVAEALGDSSTEVRVRFAFWAAEELGLLGSTNYVDSLSSDEVEAVDAYLNFDMVASPNYVRFVYDEQPAPEGSEQLTRLFAGYFERRGLEFETLPLGGRSDHGPFMGAGIPVGGLFTGADSEKSETQASTYGGEAGEPLDACYHLACDDVGNIDERALDEVSDAIAFAVATLAQR